MQRECAMFMFAAVPMLSRQVTWLLMPRRREYPSACNAMETLRLHKDTLRNGVAVDPTILMSLRAAGAGVKCSGGPCACYMKMGLAGMASKELKFYCTIESRYAYMYAYGQRP